jgi:hypothetical protein
MVEVTYGAERAALVMRETVSKAFISYLYHQPSVATTHALDV